jgi:hypothetical protein
MLLPHETTLGPPVCCLYGSKICQVENPATKLGIFLLGSDFKEDIQKRKLPNPKKKICGYLFNLYTRTNYRLDFAINKNIRH